MKMTIKYITALLTFGALLASCTKEPVLEQSDSLPQEGTRVIAVLFASQPATKTALGGEDGLTPEFVDGDEIFLCAKSDNPEEVRKEVCRVKVDKAGNAAIITHLTGDLTAFYPANAVEFFEKRNDFGIGVKQSQSGKFADANICIATIAANESTAQFKNQYALFIITPPEGTQKLTIKSLPTIGDDGQRTGQKEFVNNLAEGEGVYYLTVDNLDAKDNTYYVALLDGVILSDLSFEADFGTEGAGSIKGLPTSVITAQAAAEGKNFEDYNKVTSGTAYTITADNWHPYVTVAGHKWATMNVGAESVEDTGDYFAWGEVKGHMFSQSDKTFTEDFKNFDFSDPRYTNPKKGTVNNFYIFNAPYVSTDASPSSYPEYPGGATLRLMDDAAFANWGGSWRIPTKAEFEELLQVGCSKGATYFEFGTNLKVRFGLFGRGWYGVSSQFEHYNDWGVYWSSSLDEASTGNQQAFTLFYSNSAKTSSMPRACGFNVRAIIDEPVTVIPNK